MKFIPFNSLHPDDDEEWKMGNVNNVERQHMYDVDAMTSKHIFPHDTWQSTLPESWQRTFSISSSVSTHRAAERLQSHIWMSSILTNIHHTHRWLKLKPNSMCFWRFLHAGIYSSSRRAAADTHKKFEMNLESRFQIVGKDTSVPLPITWWVMRKYFTIIQHVEHIRSR